MQSITKSKKYEIFSMYKNQQQSVYVFCYFFSSRSKNTGLSNLICFLHLYFHKSAASIAQKFFWKKTFFSHNTHIFLL